MFPYIALILLLLIVRLSWKYHFLFNRDFTRNFEKESSIPFVKNGIPFAMLSSERMFTMPRALAKKYKRSVRGLLFHLETYCILRAADVEKILGSSSKHLTKGYVYKFLHPFLRTGLLTSDGDKWHARRKLLTPAFHFNILKEFCEIFTEESNQLVIDLNATKGSIVDIVPISTKFTLNTVCESAMGVKLSNIGNNGLSYRENIYNIGKALIFRAVRPWLHFEIMFSLLGYEEKFKSYLKPVHDFTKKIIENRREKFTHIENITKPDIEKESENIYMRPKKKRVAMLDTLLQAQFDGLIDDEGILEETDTFTFEGHDTTSAGMTFTLLLLAHHPEVQAKMYEEIIQKCDGKKDLTIDDLNSMSYMDRVLKEALRIYPPVPFIARTLVEDMYHDGHLFKKGTTMEIFIYDIHRDPEIFPDPEKFDPDRFLPQNSVERNNFAYIPFSAGMRNCIGQRFATLELKIMLAKVVRNFEIFPVTKRENLKFIADLVLRTNHPVKMRFESR